MVAWVRHNVVLVLVALALFAAGFTAQAQRKAPKTLEREDAQGARIVFGQHVDDNFEVCIEDNTSTPPCIRMELLRTYLQ